MNTSAADTKVLKSMVRVATIRKGFGGGFGRWALHPWGERVVINFIGEIDVETLKLERGFQN